MEKIMLASDYQEGAHPAIMKRLVETNLLSNAGYGADEFSESARKRIRTACACPNASVYFLVGGTQTNATVIDALLAPYQGILAAESGHISVHEAGAIEFGGHKVLTLPHHYGKITAGQIEETCSAWLFDGNRDHMVMPGMVYISQPTEYGTLYSRAELTAISEICRKFNLKLYVDGARLAYALSCPANDVTLPDLARLCSAFYIGGTKCGALFGEVVVLPDPGLIPHFFTIIKQHGALLAKGFVAGLQFDTLFTDDLYFHIGDSAIRAADKLREAFTEHGYPLAFDSPTNQIFLTVTKEQQDHLDSFAVSSFWEKPDEDHTIIRFATSWATTEEKISQLIEQL